MNQIMRFRLTCCSVLVLLVLLWWPVANATSNYASPAAADPAADGAERVGGLGTLASDVSSSLRFLSLKQRIKQQRQQLAARRAQSHLRFDSASKFTSDSDSDVEVHVDVDTESEAHQAIVGSAADSTEEDVELDDQIQSELDAVEGAALSQDEALASAASADMC